MAVKVTNVDEILGSRGGGRGEERYTRGRQQADWAIEGEGEDREHEGVEATKPGVVEKGLEDSLAGLSAPVRQPGGRERGAGVGDGDIAQSAHHGE